MEIILSQPQTEKSTRFDNEPTIYVNCISINTVDTNWANRFFTSSIEIEISGYDYQDTLQKRYSIPISFAAYIGPNSRFPVLEINNKVYFESILKGKCDYYTVIFKLKNANLIEGENISVTYEELNSSRFIINYQKFENIVRSTFKINGYNIINKVFNSEQASEFDFTINKNDLSAFVEIKLYESKIAKPDILKIACANLLDIENRNKYGLILVVSNFIPKDLKKEFVSEYGVRIYDLQDLLILSKKDTELYFSLQSFLSEALNFTVSDFESFENEKANNSTKIEILVPKSTPKKKIETKKANNFCAELNAIDPGKEDFKKYENKCIEILKYLFQPSGELSLWKEQLQSEDGLHRKDLLCRFNKTNKTYWNDIYLDFHSRYVVFEFKNYTDPITQKEVYTTEKYLYVKALHSIAIIISPKGGSDNAYKAAKGALKEAGKLILLLDNKDMCEMLKLKESAEDPAILISQRIDEMLITMNR